MQNVNEEQLAPVIIDITAAKNNQVDESYLLAMGSAIKYVLQRMFSPGSAGSFKVRGSRSEIDSFMKTLGAEKKYLQSYMKNGLNNPQTYKSGRKLSAAINNFKKVTGLKWPFK